MCLQTNQRRPITEDPTRQAGNRRRAIAAIRKRLNKAQADILSMVDGLQVTLISNRAQYEWQVSPERIAQVDAQILQTINFWLETQTDERPARWFFLPYPETATQQGAADALSTIKSVAPKTASTAQLDAITIQQIFMEPQYRLVIENIYGRAFNEMKGFAGETAADLARVLSDSVMLGQSARQAKQAIKKRFNVADSRAERIARTEINRAYTVSRTETAQQVEKKTGLDIRMLHRSSLVDRTRKWHAARHGKVYTIQEQNDWWAEGANRINCLCSISEVVVNSDGTVRSRGLREKMEKQRDIWMALEGGKV